MLLGRQPFHIHQPIHLVAEGGVLVDPVGKARVGGAPAEDFEGVPRYLLQPGPELSPGDVAEAGLLDPPEDHLLRHRVLGVEEHLEDALFDERLALVAGHVASEAEEGSGDGDDDSGGEDGLHETYSLLGWSRQHIHRCRNKDVKI